MDEMSAGEVLNGASCMLNDKHDCNGKPSNYIYCNEAFCSLESIMALRNAYIVLRDRYNKLKLENLKLMKHLRKKCKETTPTENLFDSCSSPIDPPGSVTHDAEVQPLSIACELERLRERLCSASVEIRDHIDADLKDLMTSIIPKLEDFNRQFLRFSDAHQNSPALANFHDMLVTSMDNGGHLSSEATLDDGRNFHTQDTPVVGDLVSSWDYEDSLNSNTVALINSLKDVLASISTQSSDLGTARRLLKQQNEKLLQMKIKVIPRPSSPEPAFARDSPDISGWSIIQGHNKQIYNFDINYPEI